MSKGEKPQIVVQTLEDKISETLLETRRLFVSDSIDDSLANDTIRKLWYLELCETGKPIILMINSPGGSVDSGFAIWDQIKMITSPVTTVVTGLAASMGSILSLAASKGRRFATPHARIMIHQPAVHGVIKGEATDLEIQAKEILKTRKLLVNKYVEATGKDYDVIDKAIDRDTWMTAEEAKDYGLLDGIVKSFEDL